MIGPYSRGWVRLPPSAAIALTLASVLSPLAGAGDDVPAWKKPLPGTAAFLGDDGGGENTATVCDTAEHYREWLDFGHPPGCKKFPHGLRVVIEGLMNDPAKDAEGTTWLPMVKIQIPSEGFMGYLTLMGGVHPDIPHGTLVHLKREGTEPLRLAPSQDTDLDTGPDLGEQVTAKIVRYDPSSGDHDLYVTVMAGNLAEKSGWIFSLGADGDDGKPVDMFAQSVLEVPRPPKLDRMARLYVMPERLFWNASAT